MSFIWNEMPFYAPKNYDSMCLKKLKNLRNQYLVNTKD